MIKSASILSGYPSKLPALRDRKFTFTNGINFLFGPNGCGKSSLLRTTAAYAFIESRHGGWSRSPQFAVSVGEGLPTSLSKWAPGGAQALVDWDGVAAFLLDAQLIAPQMTHFEFEANDSADGLTDVGLQMSLMRASQGQMTLAKLGRALERLSGPIPDLYESFTGAQKEYLEGLSRSGKPTLFLDEPERSLAIPLQRNLYHKMLPKLAERYQVICATHSPMCFYVPDAVYHDLESRYLSESQILMHLQFGDAKLARLPVLGREESDVKSAGEAEPQ